MNDNFTAIRQKIIEAARGFPKYSNRRKYCLRQIYDIAGLEYCKEFGEMTQDEILKNFNGIGAAGKWYNKFIPKTCGLLNVEITSADHDIGYNVGKTEQDKKETDLRFKRNMIRWIRIWTDPDKRCLLKYRIHRARQDYWFVKTFGDKAFWKDKKRPQISDEMRRKLVSRVLK